MITIDGGTGVILHNGIEIASDKMHDQWIVAANEDITSSVITSWTRGSVTGGTSGSYLTGMSHSSGVFTFPKTGIYKVDFRLGYYKNDNRRYAGAVMKLSTNSGGSYADLTRSYTSIYEDSNNAYGTTIANLHLDVQNASTYRIRFEVAAQDSIVLYGASDDIRTAVMFERIANT